MYVYPKFNVTNGILRCFPPGSYRICSHIDIMVYMATPATVGLILLLLHVSCGELDVYIHTQTCGQSRCSTDDNIPRMKFMLLSISQSARMNVSGFPQWWPTRYWRKQSLIKPGPLGPMT